MLNVCAKFQENRTYTFREITTNITNEQTNERTDKHARITISLGGANELNIEK